MRLLMQRNRKLRNSSLGGQVIHFHPNVVDFLFFKATQEFIFESHSKIAIYKCFGSWFGMVLIGV